MVLTDSAMQSRQLAYSPSLSSAKYCQTFEEIFFGMTVFAMEGMVVSNLSNRQMLRGPGNQEDQEVQKARGPIITN